MGVGHYFGAVLEAVTLFIVSRVHFSVWLDEVLL